jgi:hypothetical protein
MSTNTGESRTHRKKWDMALPQAVRGMYTIKEIFNI